MTASLIRYLILALGLGLTNLIIIGLIIPSIIIYGTEIF